MVIWTYIALIMYKQIYKGLQRIDSINLIFFQILLNYIQIPKNYLNTFFIHRLELSVRRYGIILYNLKSKRRKQKTKKTFILFQLNLIIIKSVKE